LIVVGLNPEGLSIAGIRLLRMEEPVQPAPLAWQPFTPKGIAAFAGSTFGRVFLVQLLLALLATATVLCFLTRDWFPIIRAAIAELPDQGEIRGGKLDFGGESPTRLAENRFLAVAVDLDHTGDVRSPAHVQLELGRNDVEVFSLLGFIVVPYEHNWVVALNRTDLVPWWGAWAPPILGISALLVIGGLLITWGILATVYCWIAWLTGFFANRDLRLGGSWRLAGAALMPGALLMSMGILAYALGWLDIPGLAIICGAHFVTQWFYLLVSVFALPRHPGIPKAKANPFAAAADPEK
jgi:hypothetical protein